MGGKDSVFYIYLGRQKAAWGIFLEGIEQDNIK